jgi:hypothetical protein
LVAYALADLASGIATWFTFNFLSNVEGACYCEGTRDFARRVAVNCAVVLPFLFLLLVNSPPDRMVYSFLVYFLSFVSVIPALVDWSGSSSFPPSVARVLRRIGLALGRAATATASAASTATPSSANSGSAPGPSRFLNSAWHTLLAEVRFFAHMEKWIFVWSRGKLVPKAWRHDPSARIRAFGHDLHNFDLPPISSLHANFKMAGEDGTADKERDVTKDSIELPP